MGEPTPTETEPEPTDEIDDAEIAVDEESNEEEIKESFSGSEKELEEELDELEADTNDVQSEHLSSRTAESPLHENFEEVEVDSARRSLVGEAQDQDLSEEITSEPDETAILVESSADVLANSESAEPSTVVASLVADGVELTPIVPEDPEPSISVSDAVPVTILPNPELPSPIIPAAVFLPEPIKPVSETVLTLRRMLREANEEFTTLNQNGLRLQSRIAERRNSNTASIESGTGMADPTEHYVKSVQRVANLYNVFRAKQDTFNGKIDRLNMRLDEEDENAEELRESFKAFKREICKAAVFSRTGTSISPKKVEKFEALELEKDRELEGLRLKNIHYRNQLKKQETAVKQKEQLSEGLHLIDFEQLKIENQTLNEKIEERNDDLHKLRKKVTTTVQVLTHIKEKLQFIELENVQLQEKLTRLDGDLQINRDKVTKAKRIRDRLRNENSKLRERKGFVGSHLLVQDFESRKSEIVQLKDKLNSTKEAYERLLP